MYFIFVHILYFAGKKFVCSHPGCNYSAIRKSRLEDHMNAHQGIKNHVCAICGKAFAGKKHMQRHEKIHQDFKAIACDVCEYRTHRRDKLKEHLRKHHPKEGINIGVLTEADVEREKNSPQKPRKPKKKKAPKERPETEPKKKAKAELAVANPDFVHRVSTASSQYAAPNQSLVVAALQAPPQHMPQLVQQSPLPGTTTISEDMMQYLTSFGGGPQALVQVAPTDPRVAVSVSAEQPHSAVTSPVSTPHLPVPSPSHEQTPGTQLATPVPGEQNLLFYYQIPASAQNYPWHRDACKDPISGMPFPEICLACDLELWVLNDCNLHQKTAVGDCQKKNLGASRLTVLISLISICFTNVNICNILFAMVTFQCLGFLLLSYFIKI